MSTNLNDILLKFSSRDAEWERIETRFEELAKKFEKIESDVADLMKTVEEGMGKNTGNETQSTYSVLRNPALRQLEPYSGDHRRYNK